MSAYIAFSTVYVPPNFILRDLRPADQYAAPLIDTPPAPDRLAIDLISGKAFGSGAHPTTQLCLTALAEAVTPQATVLDLGSGSGVLAIAAARLGARRTLAVDIDQAAVIRTRDNVALNAVDVDVRWGSTEIAAPDAPFDVLVANLLSPVILKLAPQLPALLAPHSRLILSGILNTQADRVRAGLNAAGIHVTEARSKSGWSAFIARLTA